VQGTIVFRRCSLFVCSWYADTDHQWRNHGNPNHYWGDNSDTYTDWVGTDDYSDASWRSITHTHDYWRSNSDTRDDTDHTRGYRDGKCDQYEYAGIESCRRQQWRRGRDECVCGDDSSREQWRRDRRIRTRTDLDRAGASGIRAGDTRDGDLDSGRISE